MLRACCELCCGHKGSAGRDAGQYAVVVCEHACSLDGIGIGDGQYLIHNVGIVDVGHESRTDTLKAVWAFLSS